MLNFYKVSRERCWRQLGSYEWFIYLYLDQDGVDNADDNYKNYVLKESFLIFREFAMTKSVLA